MLSLGIVDANERANKKYAGIVASIVGGWLQFEADEAGVSLVSPDRADVVLLTFAGAMDFLPNSRRYLKKYAIQPDPSKRQHEPYIITGGAVDASPFEALSIADALAVGEAYTFVRELLKRISNNTSLRDIRSWITDYPHAIERTQIATLQRDPERPWLLADTPPILATPDGYVDWMGVPPIRSDDDVTRVIGSKGCHCKCSFCATTYRQSYRVNPNDAQVVRTVAALERQGERVQVISNDPANIPFWKNIQTRMASQSFTIMEMRDPSLRDTLKKTGVGIARYGVEGVSERLRVAFGKAISNDELLDITAEMHAAKINTRWFMIMGAPFETGDDWQSFREVHYKLARLLDWGVCQIKMTAFVPNPPAPLVRFLPSFGYHKLLDSHVQWTLQNAVSRHVMVYYGKKRKSQVASIAEQLAVTPSVINHLADVAEWNNGVYDLFPTPDDMGRATWEVVQWPIPAQRRWKIAETYQRRMTGQSLLSRQG